MRKRKVTYPQPKTTSKGASIAAAAAKDARAQMDRATSIDLSAMTGRATKPGDRVRIASGLYAGEIAVVESIAGGVIPAAVVRTEAGRTRRARTIDLIPEPQAKPEPKAEPGAAARSPEAPAAE